MAILLKMGKHRTGFTGMTDMIGKHSWFQLLYICVRALSVKRKLLGFEILVPVNSFCDSAMIFIGKVHI